MHEPLQRKFCFKISVRRDVGLRTMPDVISAIQRVARSTLDVSTITTTDKFMVFVYDCPFGTFFSELKKQCDHSYMVTCDLDPCGLNNDTLTYEQKVDVGIPNCRSYWVCRDSKSYATCCASGFKYAEGYGCIKDATCRDHCYSQNRCIEPEKGSTCRSYFNCTDEETFQPLCCPLGQAYHVDRKICVPDGMCKADCNSACPYQKVYRNRKLFLHGGQLKRCPMGTVFRADICACALDDDYHPNGKCMPKVDLSFSGNKMGSPHVSYFGLDDKLGVGRLRPPVSSLSIGGCSGLVDRNGNNLNTYYRGQMDDNCLWFNMPTTDK
ncbi:hypothetical protein KUTeg_008609 [Tegillarca granosa]|uniref:4Fe-4S ferredoxin-type domain-containing protein n=1 Tax=Tegillarca granosa TaxID=220873 RepID=A0ABQ9F9M6_TEGGR|nr:hypothetical protein KUTeg_008609 [Tegillarca granosa]